MKTLITSLLLILTSTLNSQIITCKISKWTEFDIPENMSLHDAAIQDSVISTGSFTGELIYQFNLNDKSIFIHDDANWKSEFTIVEVYRLSDLTLVNVDAVQFGNFYNFMITENIDDDLSLLVLRFDTQLGRRHGVFSNHLDWITVIDK